MFHPKEYYASLGRQCAQASNQRNAREAAKFATMRNRAIAQEYGEDDQLEASEAFNAAYSATRHH